MGNVEYGEDVKRVSEDEVLYYGYRVMKNGDIISQYGNRIHAYNFCYPYSHVTLRINGKQIKKNNAILVYELFSGKALDKRKYVIQFKDHDTKNQSYENLYAIKKSDYIKKLKKNKREVGRLRFTTEQREEIRNEYREGNVSMRQLSAKYNACLTTIQRIINKEGENSHVCSTESKESSDSNALSYDDYGTDRMRHTDI